MKKTKSIKKICKLLIMVMMNVIMKIMTIMIITVSRRVAKVAKIKMTIKTTLAYMSMKMSLQVHHAFYHLFNLLITDSNNKNESTLISITIILIYMYILMIKTNQQPITKTSTILPSSRIIYMLNQTSSKQISSIITKSNGICKTSYNYKLLR